MNQDLSERKKFEALNNEYREYIEKLQREWLPHNQVSSTRVYETMYAHEQAQVHEKMDEWSRYITPFAEAWWKERGYGVIWPDDNSQPMQVFKLEDS